MSDMSAASDDDDDSIIKFLRIDFLDDMFTKILTQSCETSNLTEDPHKIHTFSRDYKCIGGLLSHA